MRRFPKVKADPDKAADPQAVRSAAVAVLAARDFASTELCEKLKSKGYDAAIVAETVQELLNGGILNDARYAERFVVHHADRGQGPVRIRGALQSLGLPSELIESALDS